MKQTLLAFLLLAFVGCESHTSHTYHMESMGIVQDMNVVPTSFNEAIKSVIKTDSYVFGIIGIPLVAKGQKIYAVVSDDHLIQYYTDSLQTYRLTPTR